MHVLYVIDSLVAGGAERSLADLAPHYRGLGIDLDVAYLHERDGVGPQLEAAGAQLFSLAGSRGRAGWAQRAIALTRRRRPDLIHTTLFEADIAGRIASTVTRVPVVSSLVNVAYGSEQLANAALSARRVRAAQLLDAITARRVKRFHAVSVSVADVMATRLRIPRTRIDVVTRGRDPEQLGSRTGARRRAARTMLGAGEEVLVLAVGRQEYQKGFDVLVRAFAQLGSDLAGARLLIAGREGGATASLHELVETLGLEGRVKFLGTRADVPDLLAAADVFAFPSRWEGLPGTVLEAMALEAPIVATAIPPVIEVLEDEGRGWLVPVDDVGALADAIGAAVRDPNRAARTTAARARFLERYTTARVAEGMLDFYLRATNT